LAVVLVKLFTTFGKQEVFYIMSLVKMNDLEKLSICKADAGAKFLNCFPDFLILGPQRTGTTWLAVNLMHHPEVFMPHQKELYYFSTVDKPKKRANVSNRLEWYLSNFHESFYSIARKEIEMLIRFRIPYSPRVRGEGTATYAAGISNAVMNELVTLNPDIKCILMIRNPIKRAWAHAKMDLMNVSRMNAKVRDVEACSRDELLDFVHSSYQVNCGKYRNQIDRWNSYLKPGNLFIGFFDNLTEDPVNLLLSVYHFLGVESDTRFVTDLAFKKIGATDKGSSQREMPPFVRSALENLFADELWALEKRFSRQFIH